MPYIDLRYTPMESGDISFSSISIKNTHRGVVEKLINYISSVLVGIQSEREMEARDEVSYIVSEEMYNKFGEQTHLHYHMNFSVPHHAGNYEFKKETIQKHLNREFKLKGNKMYCLRVHSDMPKDVERWWRYTCKQGKPIMKKNFSDIEVDEMYKIASAEYEQRKIENCETRQKLIDKNNFRNKIVKHLKDAVSKRDKHGCKLTDKMLWLAIAQFYRDNHMTPAYGKLDDLVIDMKVEIGYITLEEYYETTH